MMMKMTKNIIQESASSTEKLVNALWIWKPTPLELPKVSVSASSFHESANETRAAASRNGSTAGTITNLVTAPAARLNARLIDSRPSSAEATPAATLIETAGSTSSMTTNAGPMSLIPKTTSEITA